MQRDDFLWVEKYRPHKISDCVLPSDLSEPFSEFVEHKVNLFHRWTLSRQRVSDETKTDYLMVNGSDGRL